MSDTVEQTKQQVSQITGFQVDRIGVVRLQLSQLSQEGVLVDLEVGGVTMFTRQADWSDLGINTDDIRATRMTRGKKFLIDEERVKRVRSWEQTVRQGFASYTVDISGFRPWRYLHYRRYDAFRAWWDKKQAELAEIKADILDHYDEDVLSLESDFRAVAAASWKSITAQGYKWAIIEGKPYDDPDEFISEVVSRALAKCPSRERIESQLHADYRVSIPQTPAEYEAQMAQAAIDRANADVEAARVRAKADEEYMQASILREQYNHEQRIMRIEEQERQLQIDVMMHAEADHIREQFAQEVSPIEQIFTDVRQQMAEAAIEIQQSIEKNGFVRGKVAQRAAGLVEFFDLIKIQDDYKLRAALLKLHDAVGPVGDARGKDTPLRSAAEVMRALRSISELADNAKDDLLSGPSAFSLIE
jgi:hypothetical protein